MCRPAGQFCYQIAWNKAAQLDMRMCVIRFQAKSRRCTACHISAIPRLCPPSASAIFCDHCCVLRVGRLIRQDRPIAVIACCPSTVDIAAMAVFDRYVIIIVDIDHGCLCNYNPANVLSGKPGCRYVHRQPFVINLPVLVKTKTLAYLAAFVTASWLDCTLCEAVR
jgi:hypothetical protein